MSHVTSQYLDDCIRDGSLLGKAAAEVSLPPAYAKSYGQLLLGRPLFVDKAEITSFADDLIALFDLLSSLPERCFDGDLRVYCAALGMDERLGPLIRLGATGHPVLYGRADAYHDGSSFRLLEFNVGSELGGIDAAQMNRAFLEVESFRNFSDRHELTFVDTAAILADELRSAGQRVATAGEDPVVALLEGAGGLSEHEGVFLAIQEAMRGCGIDLLLGELDQARFRKGKLVLDGRPVDVVLRYFAAGQVVDDPVSRQVLETLMRAHEAGTTAVFTPLEGALFASKASLALVHDPRLRESFTPGERALVDRIVPWTRLVRGASTMSQDFEALVEQCRDGRSSLILKPGMGYGGVGAVHGRTVEDGEWSDALRLARGQDYVVQSLVAPATESVFNPDTGEIEDWAANWGIFATRRGYAGAFVRALQPMHGSIISYSNPETRGSCVFSAPSTPAA